jgi:hypothetical protein
MTPSTLVFPIVKENSETTITSRFVIKLREKMAELLSWNFLKAQQMNVTDVHETVEWFKEDYEPNDYETDANESNEINENQLNEIDDIEGKKK